MDRPFEPGRRRWLVSSLGVPAVMASAGLAACSGAAGDRVLLLPTLAAAQEEVARLARAPGMSSSAEWPWPQTLIHCAQSIEFSMVGFPQPKSALFQSTVGALAIQVFGWRGRMTHDRAEPIPGAPALDGAATSAQAQARLAAAIEAFQKWTGPLKPHFAYGHLDKAAYERAHAYHLADHLSAFDVRNDPAKP